MTTTVSEDVHQSVALDMSWKRIITRLDYKLMPYIMCRAMYDFKFLICLSRIQKRFYM